MSEKPVLVPTLEKIPVKTMSCGMRHSVVVNTDGKVFTFGDNTDSQCGLQVARTDTPIEHETTFKAVACFSGTAHNVLRDQRGNLYRWGGESYFNLMNEDFDDSHFKYMDDFKGKKVKNIKCSHDNIVVVTHQRIKQKEQ
jgi:alpha-tubulin suppressor-like RCC1 family protein